MEEEGKSYKPITYGYCPMALLYVNVYNGETIYNKSYIPVEKNGLGLTANRANQSYRNIGGFRWKFERGGVICNPYKIKKLELRTFSILTQELR